MPGRRGLTLLEVLLVLCLLVVLASVAWPVLEGPLANQRLREAADQVRTQWTHARVDAMSSGRTHVFSFLPGTNLFQVACQDDVEPASGDGAEETPTATSGQLPEGCLFVAADAPPASSDDVSVATDDGGKASDLLSLSVYFFPDGTTSDAVVVLMNERGRRINLNLRGLTGITTVGDWYVVAP